VLPRAATAAALAALALAAPASAASVTVAEAGGARLEVRDGPRGELCTTLIAAPERADRSGTCNVVPSRPENARWDTVPNGAGREWIGGVVTARVAAVEPAYRPDVRFRAPTVPGDAYRGRARGRVRFFLLEVTGAPRPDPPADPEPELIRFYDAAGQLVGADSEEDYPLFEQPLRGPVTLLRTPGVAVRAEVSRGLRPTPLALDRLEQRVCLVLERRPQGGVTSSYLCQGPEPYRPPLRADATTGCGAAGHGVAALVGNEVAAVVLVLGSGRRLPARIAGLPAELGVPGRYVAVAVPRREAVRRIVAFDASGRLLTREDLGAEPGRPCPFGGGGVITSTLPGSLPDPVGVPGPAGQVAAGPADPAAPSPRLLVREEGDFVCARLEKLSPDGADCLLPPREFYEVWIQRSGDAVGAVVPPEVRSVVVETPGGRRRAATTEGVTYDGRYRGHVRFFLVTGARRAYSVDLLDARGRLLAILPGADVPPLTGRRTFLRGRGWRLVGGRLAFRAFDGQRVRRLRERCFELVLGADERGCFGFLGTASAVTAEVSCSPRLVLLYGSAVGRGRRVTVRLDDGRRLRAPVVGVRRGAGVWALAVRRTRSVAAVSFGSRTLRLNLPPAARQCGYSLTEFVLARENRSSFTTAPSSRIRASA